ncbi:T9SS type A sorting domain-containing protein, partial [bacterium]
PNPFNNQTVIAFDVDEGGDLILDILDLQGRTVTRMFRGYLESGHHHVTLNGSDMVSGYYFIRLRGSDRVDIRKMVLLK